MLKTTRALIRRKKTALTSVEKSIEVMEKLAVLDGSFDEHVDSLTDMAMHLEMEVREMEAKYK